MSNYLYLQHEREELTNRFNIEIRGEGYTINGLEEWRRLISLLLYVLHGEADEINERRQNIRTLILKELSEVSGSNNFNAPDQENLMPDGRATEELIVTLLLVRLRGSYHTLPGNTCPRLFISHRRADENYALRIAELAVQNGFAYWVDVLDPDLQSLANTSIPEKLFPLLTACIIEMGLINCTHVIACLTPNSRGTLWIPYEYGRITELPGLNINACVWLDPNLLSVDFPEYMLLGEISTNEMEIESWLKNERSTKNKNCKPDTAGLSSYGKLNKLPEQSNEELERKKEAFEKWLSQGMPLLKDLEITNIPLKFKKRTRPST